MAAGNPAVVKLRSSSQRTCFKVPLVSPCSAPTGQLPKPGREAQIPPGHCQQPPRKVQAVALPHSSAALSSPLPPGWQLRLAYQQLWLRGAAQPSFPWGGGWTAAFPLPAPPKGTDDSRWENDLAGGTYPQPAPATLPLPPSPWQFTWSPRDANTKAESTHSPLQQGDAEEAGWSFSRASQAPRVSRLWGLLVGLARAALQPHRKATLLLCWRRGPGTSWVSQHRRYNLPRAVQGRTIKEKGGKKSKSRPRHCSSLNLHRSFASPGTRRT